MCPPHPADPEPARGPGPDPGPDPNQRQLLRELLTTYTDLNGSVVDELDEEPSALEFMRYVARNTPFVVRGCASGWEALRRWDRRFLVEAMRGKKVNVAVTPRG